MAKIPQPEFILLKEAAKRLKTEVDYLLALAGEDELTLWVCYLSTQQAAVISNVGQKVPAYWALRPEQCRELRTYKEVLVRLPGTFGAASRDGHYVSYKSSIGCNPDIISPEFEENVVFRRAVNWSQDLTNLYIKLSDFQNFAETDERKKGGRIYGEPTILAGIYKTVYPKGTWKDCPCLSFHGWLENLVEKCDSAEALLFKLEGKFYNLVIESGTGTTKDMFQARYCLQGEKMAALKSCSEDSFRKALSSKSTKQLIDVKGITLVDS